MRPVPLRRAPNRAEVRLEASPQQGSRKAAPNSNHCLAADQLGNPKTEDLLLREHPFDSELRMALIDRRQCRRRRYTCTKGATEREARARRDEPEIVLSSEAAPVRAVARAVVRGRHARIGPRNAHGPLFQRVAASRSPRRRPANSSGSTRRVVRLGRPHRALQRAKTRTSLGLLCMHARGVCSVQFEGPV